MIEVLYWIHHMYWGVKAICVISDLYDKARTVYKVISYPTSFVWKGIQPIIEFPSHPLSIPCKSYDQYVVDDTQGYSDIHQQEWTLI